MTPLLTFTALLKPAELQDVIIILASLEWNALSVGRRPISHFSQHNSDLNVQIYLHNFISSSIDSDNSASEYLLPLSG